MKRKIAFWALLSFCCVASVSAKKKPLQIYQDSSKTVEERVSDLVGKMTLEEKIFQLNQYMAGSNDNKNNKGDEVNNIPAEIGSLIYGDEDAVLRNQLQHKAMEKSRLGIPILFGHDVIHGFRTIYPIPLAVSCSWNPELASKACSMAAVEARKSGIDWTFSPMIDIARDARWGRIAEGYGEDPYTASVFTAAAVKGYQGNDLSSTKSIAACLKHFVGYGASEAGRDYVYTEISRQSLWDTYLPPYEAGIKAGAATVMSAFNCINGIPASANPYTMVEILKKRWGHDGFVVSDWGAVSQLMLQGVAATEKEATYKAFTSGVEMDMADNLYGKHMKELVEEGKVSQAAIDDAVKRVLRIKFRLGLFDHPYSVSGPEKERLLQPSSLEMARKMAEESMVLLKNENSVLPLSTDAKIAVVGPLAKDQADLLGSWHAHGHAEDVISIYDGLKSVFPEGQLTYAQGCAIEGEDASGFDAAVNAARNSNVIVLCLGEKSSWSGENASRASISLPAIQEKLLVELSKTGKPVVLILSNGRPLDLSRMVPLCKAVVEMWQPGVTGGKALANVLSGAVNPSGKLSVTFPYNLGQIPIYYNRRNPARNPTQGFYQDMTIEPLYPFGYGLSYTKFEYGDISASSLKVKPSDELVLKVDVRNAGERDGAEVAQWFISAKSCSIARPMKELKFFEKREIKKGETTTFEWKINPLRDLSFVNEDGHHFLDPGSYTVSIGNKQVNIEVTE